MNSNRTNHGRHLTMPTAPPFPSAVPSGHNSARRYTVPAPISVPAALMTSEPGVVVIPLSHDPSFRLTPSSSLPPMSMSFKHTESLPAGSVTLTVTSRSGGNSSEPWFRPDDTVEGTVSFAMESSMKLKSIEIAVQQLELGHKNTILGETKHLLWSTRQSSSSWELTNTNSNSNLPFSLAIPSVASSASSVMSNRSTSSTSSGRSVYQIELLLRRPGLNHPIHIIQPFSIKPFPETPFLIPPFPSPPAPISSPLPTIPLAAPPQEIIMALKRQYGIRGSNKHVDVKCKIEVPADLKIHLPHSIPLRLTLTCDKRDVLDSCSVSAAIHVKLIKSVAFGDKAESIDPKHQAEYAREETVKTAEWDRDEAGEEDIAVPTSSAFRPSHSYQVVLHGKIPTDGLTPTLHYGYGAGTGTMVVKYVIRLFPLTPKGFEPAVPKNRILFSAKIEVAEELRRPVLPLSPPFPSALLHPVSSGLPSTSDVVPELDPIPATSPLLSSQSWDGDMLSSSTS